jgi:hypothetical protein
MLLSLPMSSAAVQADNNPIPNPSCEKLDDTDWAAAWGRYNWGLEGSDGTQQVDTTVDRRARLAGYGPTQSRRPASDRAGNNTRSGAPPARQRLPGFRARWSS